MAPAFLYSEFHVSRQTFHVGGLNFRSGRLALDLFADVPACSETCGGGWQVTPHVKRETSDVARANPPLIV